MTVWWATGKKKGRIGFMENAGMRAVWPGSGVPPGGSLLAARRWRDPIGGCVAVGFVEGRKRVLVN